MQQCTITVSSADPAAAIRQLSLLLSQNKQWQVLVRPHVTYQPPAVSPPAQSTQAWWVWPVACAAVLLLLVVALVACCCMRHAALPENEPLLASD